MSTPNLAVHAEGVFKAGYYRVALILNYAWQAQSEAGYSQREYNIFANEGVLERNRDSRTESIGMITRVRARLKEGLSRNAHRARYGVHP